jgi:hypothetical protein
LQEKEIVSITRRNVCARVGFSLSFRTVLDWPFRILDAKWLSEAPPPPGKGSPSARYRHFLIAYVCHELTEVGY